MKNSQTYIICGIIIILHLVLGIYIFSVPTSKKSDDDQKREEVSEELGNELPPMEESSIPEEPVQEYIGPYSSSFFRSDVRQLPKNLQQMVATLPSYLVVDLDGRRLLSGKEANVARPFASITKMMTVYLAVKKMKASNGNITLATPIKVSAAASQVKERRVWLSPKETFTFDEMLKACLVHSANDCAYLLAEFCGGGNEQAFVAEMNKEAAALGCHTLKYYNANGLPVGGKENSGSPLELAYLALRMMEHPEIMRWTGVKMEYLREHDAAFIKRNGGPTMLTSSNKLLGRCPGVNGMKTGYTNKAGHCIVATCERNGKRVAVIILGGTKERDRIATNLIEWAYSNL